MKRLLALAALVPNCRVDSEKVPNSVSSSLSRAVTTETTLPASRSLPSANDSREQPSACLNAISGSLSLRERLARTIGSCSGGLHVAEPLSFKLDATAREVVIERQWQAPTCVRFVVVADPSDRSIGADISDEAHTVLSAARGAPVLLLPANGVLCLPERTPIRVRVHSEGDPAEGLLAAMTDPQ